MWFLEFLSFNICPKNALIAQTIDSVLTELVRTYMPKDFFYELKN